MKYYYSVVQYVPDSFRGEFVNVAVIVGNADSCEWRVRRVGNVSRARGLGASTSLATVWRYLDDIENLIVDLTDDISEANPEIPQLDRTWMETEHRRLRNLVQLSEPTVVIAEDVEEATQKIFDTFIVDPDRQKRNTRSRAISTLRDAYLSNLDRQLVHERVQGQIGHQRVDIDFAVSNGALAQLAHAWSFRVQNTQLVVEKIKAWSWTLRDVRDGGGEIHVSGREEPYRLTSDVPVEVVYDKPETDQGKRALDESLEVFDRLQVTALTTDHVERVAQNALESLSRRRISDARR
ncbi:MAG: DUF3037 domain-containing protein [Pseudonocardia sp.]